MDAISIDQPPKIVECKIGLALIKKVQRKRVGEVKNTIIELLSPNNILD